MLRLLFLSIALLMLSLTFAFSNNKNENIQREPHGTFDIQLNTESDFSFYVTNYGIMFLDVSRSEGGGYWPRGSNNQYIFGGGFWFGAKKMIEMDSTNQQGGTDTYPVLNKMVEVSYNPNSGMSWFGPGRMEDGEEVDMLDKNTYRVYFSTDFDESGVPLIAEDGPNWCLWNTAEKSDNEFGDYIPEAANRNLNINPLGPVYISDEDIFSTYKDTDLDYYEGGVAFREHWGYPLGLQCEQTVLSWNDDEKKDMVIIFYKFINTSEDTLLNCWFAPVMDVDIAEAPNTMAGAADDYFRYFEEQPDLNLGIGWSGIDRLENPENFGYIGVSFVMTPEIDNYGVLKEGLPKDYSKQRGLVTFRNWSIVEDLQEDGARYDYISSEIKDNYSTQGDGRMLLSTGPFTMMPNDTGYLAVQINFAMPSAGQYPTGEEDDLSDLVQKVELGHNYFYETCITKIEEQIEQHNTIKISPNPATEYIEISLADHRVIQYGEIEILDVLGRRHTPSRNTSGHPSREGNYRLDVSHLQPGIYFIRIGDEFLKFVKM